MSLTQTTLEPFLAVRPSVSAGEGLELLRQSQRRFGLIGDLSDGRLVQPQALVQAAHLERLAEQEPRPLGELLAELPQLIIAEDDDGPDAWEPPRLRRLASLLQKTGAPGLVIWREGEVAGVLGRSALARSLPLSALLAASSQRSYGYTGRVSTPIFICRKCSPPHPIRSPSHAEKVPRCPRNDFHGLMELEQDAC